MSHKFNIGDAFFTNVGGSNYIDVEYFNGVMCSFGYGLPPEWIDIPTPATLPPSEEGTAIVDSHLYVFPVFGVTP
jgi:hypothetical protein